MIEYSIRLVDWSVNDKEENYGTIVFHQDYIPSILYKLRRHEQVDIYHYQGRSDNELLYSKARSEDVARLL
jgi:hypothetical protein